MARLSCVATPLALPRWTTPPDSTSLRKARAKVAAQTSRTDHRYPHSGSQELAMAKQGNGCVSDPDAGSGPSSIRPSPLYDKEQFLLIRAQFQSEKRIV